MLDAHVIYRIAKSYRAEITESRQIQWHGMVNSLGNKSYSQWESLPDYRPSVMDSVILQRAWRVPGYLEAAMAATGWTRSMVMGFLQAMLLGHPLKTEEIRMEEFPYFKGMLIGLMVIQKLKSRLWEAESHFS